MDEISSNITSHVKDSQTTAGRTIDQAQEKKLKKACADFESMLVFQLLKTMRQTVPKNGLLKPSQGEETYRMMMDQNIADDLANKGQGLGLQKMLYKQIIDQNYRKD
jgi:Rod binding domain-containing protein